MTGLSSSAFERESTPSNIPIAVNTEILVNDLEVTASMLNGDSGLLRLWWSFETSSDYQLTITKNGAADLLGFPLKVNADNSFTLVSNGYYRFDIGVKVGDLINFSSNIEITKVNDLQIQQIQIGA